MPIDELIRHFSVRSTFVCARCGSHDGYNRERHGLIERYVFPLMMIQPMCCYDCGERLHWLPAGLLPSPVHSTVSPAHSAPVG